MSVIVVGVDHTAGAREALLLVHAAGDTEHHDAGVLAEIVRRGRRS